MLKMLKIQEETSNGPMVPEGFLARSLPHSTLISSLCLEATSLTGHPVTGANATKKTTKNGKVNVLYSNQIMINHLFGDIEDQIWIIKHYYYILLIIKYG